MRTINAGVSTVNDDEHFGRKVSATAVKQDARHLDIGDLVRMLRAKKNGVLPADVGRR